MYKRLVLLTVVLLLCTGVKAQRNFIFNTDITGFKYEGFSGNTYVYTANRLPKEDAKRIFTGITIIPTPDLTWEQAQERLQQMIKMPVQGNITYSNFKKEDISFNGYKAATLQFTMTEGGKPMQGYMALLFGNNTSVMFLGMDTENRGRYLEKFKASLKTMKLK